MAEEVVIKTFMGQHSLDSSKIATMAEELGRHLKLRKSQGAPITRGVIKRMINARWAYLSDMEREKILEEVGTNW